MSGIHIQALRVSTFIGVPDGERATSQELEIDLHIAPSRAFAEMEDRIERTVDYAAVCERVSALALERPRRLIETLAVDITRCVRTEFGAAGVAVEIRKFILPQTRHVAVRHAEGSPVPAEG